MGKNGVTGMIVPLEGETINRVLHHRPIIAIFVDEFPSDLDQPLFFGIDVKGTSAAR